MRPPGLSLVIFCESHAATGHGKGLAKDRLFILAAVQRNGAALAYATGQNGTLGAAKKKSGARVYVYYNCI